MIDNKTVLNTALFTPLSSGAIDNHLYKEVSENKPVYPIDPERQAKIPIGDRQTVHIFNDQYEYNDIVLWTNFYLLDLHHLDVGKTVFINFKTTAEHSFNICTNGSKEFNGDLHKLETADLWIDKGMVENLAKYFVGDEELEFNFSIHKPNPHAYIIGVQLGPKENLATITYDSGSGRGSIVEQWPKGTPYTIRDYSIRNRDFIWKAWHKFNGWTIGGTTLNPGDTIVPIGDIALKATWARKNEFSLTQE